MAEMVDKNCSCDLSGQPGKYKFEKNSTEISIEERFKQLSLKVPCVPVFDPKIMSKSQWKKEAKKAKKLDFENKQKLEKALKAASEGQISLFCMGQNEIVEMAEVAADRHLLREYPEIYYFDMNSEGKIGLICIPENFLSKYPWVVEDPNSEEAKKILEDNLTDKQSLGEIRQVKGEIPEKKIFEEFFRNTTDTILMIHGNQLPIVLGDSEMAQELDFIVTNFTKQYILNIEVKSWLGPNTENPEKNQNFAIDAKNQGRRIQKLMEDLFGSGLEGNWNYVSMVACKNMSVQIEKCEKCMPYVSNLDDLADKIKVNEQSLENNENQQKYPDEFKRLAKYLLFCMPLVPLPVKGQYHKKIQEAMKKVGSYDNIMLWCFPTRDQRDWLDCPKVVFCAPWGSGKTLFMVTKAICEAKKGNKVIFFIFNAARFSSKTLLCYQLEKRFMDYENIIVKQIDYDPHKVF